MNGLKIALAALVGGTIIVETANRFARYLITQETGWSRVKSRLKLSTLARPRPVRPRSAAPRSGPSDLCQC
jgi:hypothetical protein